MIANDVGSQSHAKVGNGFTGWHGRHDHIPVWGLRNWEFLEGFHTSDLKVQVSGSAKGVGDLWRGQDRVPIRVDELKDDLQLGGIQDGSGDLPTGTLIGIVKFDQKCRGQPCPIRAGTIVDIPGVIFEEGVSADAVYCIAAVRIVVGIHEKLEGVVLSTDILEREQDILGVIGYL